MTTAQYPPARLIAEPLRAHFEGHIGAARRAGLSYVAEAPDGEAIEAMIDAAFWASLRHEEGFVPNISLAFLPPDDDRSPLRLGAPLPLTPEVLTRLSPAVERPGIHLGVWRYDGALAVWGTTRDLPPFCFVVEVSAAGLLVVKHRRGEDESGKFLNVAVLEGQETKILDPDAAHLPGCPELVKTLLGTDRTTAATTTNALVALALSMRRHGRGGTLLVVPSGSDAWRGSIRQPIPYPVVPPFGELAALVDASPGDKQKPRWPEAFQRSIDHIGGLTAVDGATVLNDRYELLAFGAKIGRADGASRVDQILVTEPVEGAPPLRALPAHIGGTRHQSAAQFVRDQHDAIAFVASQDRRFTIFAWSPSEGVVQGHRVETLLL
jgi:hypothetical protein